jgi:amino acid transporter
MKEPSASPPGPNLRAGALGLSSILMQGITHIAPAVALLVIPFITTHAGPATPLAFVIGFGLILTLGISLTQLARHLPSAGGYYTYVSRTVHPRAGFLTAWLYFLYDPTATAINLAFMGAFVEKIVPCPWWIFFLAATALITVLTYRGIEISSHILMGLGIVEIAIVVALGATGLFRPGPGGVTLAPFDPRNAPSFGGLGMGLVFAILSFSGFESVAPLAEESRDPRRNLPRAIIGSIILMGIFFVFISYSMLVGWGTDEIPALGKTGEDAAAALGRRLWGPGWVLIPLAILNSILAVSIASTNAATRVFFAMGRGGALPRVLGVVHPVFRTPRNAILVQTAATLAVGLGLGFCLGPASEYYLMGVAVSLGMVLVYCAGNLGVWRLYRGERRSEFKPILHAVFPLFSSVAMIGAGAFSIIPLPEPPVRWAPFIVLGWLMVGVLLLVIMRLTGREDWILEAGRAAFEKQEPAAGAPE